MMETWCDGSLQANQDSNGGSLQANQDGVFHRSYTESSFRQDSEERTPS